MLCDVASLRTGTETLTDVEEEEEGRGCRLGMGRYALRSSSPALLRPLLPGRGDGVCHELLVISDRAGESVPELPEWECGENELCARAKDAWACAWVCGGEWCSGGCGWGPTKSNPPMLMNAPAEWACPGDENCPNSYNSGAGGACGDDA